MKIRKLIIDNLRGLSHVECDFDQSTNVIVGPNAIGKTTILEAVRLTKALLMPRYTLEGQQVLVSLSAMSSHPHLSNYLDFPALARNPEEPVQVSLGIEINAKELEYLKSVQGKIALQLLRGQMARTDEQSQLALTQFMSSNEGQSRLIAATNDVKEKLEMLQAPYTCSVQLTIDGRSGRIHGADPFNQTLVVILEQQCAPHQALFSYFPADRAFPAGEANVQIGSAEANNQIQSHIGQAPTKYQRLKQTIVNNLLLSELDQEVLRGDFQLVFEKLLPGKELVGLSVTPVGTLKVSICESATGKVFDIDSMSSGEKGLILTFMLLRRSLARGGIALVDEPELHLNPAVCKNIIPFLSESIVGVADLQVLLCTHSAEILGTAFDRQDCSIHHLRSHKDATKIYERDSHEVFEALRRLGTTAAETLFSRGNVFVEGEHDVAILEEGFYDQVMGYKITSLGGRKEVEKEIATLQDAEKKGELDKLNCFIFDLDRRSTEVQSSDLVRVLQWDRYCLENYLLDQRILFDELQEAGATEIESRGTFESRLVELAMIQLNEVVAKQVYLSLEPENPGLRSKEIEKKSFLEIGEVLAKRLVTIKSELSSFNPDSWKSSFVSKCEEKHSKMREEWRDGGWIRLCSGKRLIDDLFAEYTVKVPKFDFKRRLVKKMKLDQTEDWTLVKSKIRDALGA